MIKIYDYSLSRDGKLLTIHVAANKTSPTVDAVLNTIAISTDGDEYGASAKAFGAYLVGELEVATLGGTESNPIWTLNPAYKDELDITINLENVGVAGGCAPYLGQVYYLHITASSVHSSCATVGEKDVITFDKYPLYKAITCAMDSLKGCEPPQIITDYLMKLKTLEAYIELGVAYREEINFYYNWFVKKAPIVKAPTNLHIPGNISRPCGCGR